MVDFSRKIKKNIVEIETNPIKIYDNLDRKTEKGPLRNEQIEILEKWYEQKQNDSNTILKLNTGKGKTIIGLLILQSKLNSLKRPVMYICPNKNLVNQTIKQANEFGIKTCKVNDSREIPLEFTNAESILVTHVQYMFHGFSKFGDETNYEDCCAIVIDDAHATIDSIKQSTRFSITKNQSPNAYSEIMELFDDDIKSQGIGTYNDLKNEKIDSESMLPVPYWALKEKNEKLTKILSNYSRSSDEIKFTWPLLKDIISNTDCYISNNRIEIVPYSQPMEQFGTFYNADNKIYMSATNADDAIMIKEFGLTKKEIMNPLKLENESWSGEKMVLIPSLISDDLNRREIVNYFGTIQDRNFEIFDKIGKVALTPSFSRTNDWKKYGSLVVYSDTIDASIGYLSDQRKPETVVLSNRYDGIDLPDDFCRILILDSLPKFESLEDKYINHVIPNSSVLNREIAQKIEQGFGRSVRGEKDYSAIIVVGTDLVRFLKTKSNQQYVSKYTKKQIQIGEQIVEFAKEDLDNDNTPLEVFWSLIFQLLNRDEGWKEFYKEQMNEASYEDDYNQTLIDRYIKEREVYQLVKSGKIEESLSKLQEFIDHFPDNNYERGYYLQIMAKFIYSLSKSESNRIQTSAHNHNSNLLAYPHSINRMKINLSGSLSQRLNNIMKEVENFNDSEELTLFINDLHFKLSFNNDSDDFEKTIDTVGKLLGFETQRPDNDFKEGPDNLWAVGNNEYFIIECKNEVNESRTYTYKKEIGQINNSIGWFQREYPSINHSNFLIIPTKQYDSAADFNEEVKIVRKNKLNLFKTNFINFLNEFTKEETFNLTEDKIANLIEIHNLDLESLKSDYFEFPVPWNTTS